MKLGLIVSALLLAGCGGMNAVDQPAYNAGDYLAAGVLRGLGDPAAKKEIDDLVTSAAISGRDVVLGEKTHDWIVRLETDLLLELRRELKLLVVESKEEVLRDLDAQVKKIVSAAVASVPLNDVREQLVGAPLRQDLRLALTDLDPQLQDMIRRASANAATGASGVIASDVAVIDQDLSKWKWIAITLAVAVFILVFMHAHAVHAMNKRND
jgi:hypothetical protein